MPTYVYECRTCRERFERMQRFSDPPVEDCPDCGGSVRRVLQPAAIHFKGSGFYVNDYKQPGPPPTPCESAPACSSTTCPAKQAAEAAA